MNCKNCGYELTEKDQYCPNCGNKAEYKQQYCPNCGAEVDPRAVICVSCGYQLPQAKVNNPQAKSKLAAGLLGIFIGSLGVHNFYLGYSSKAVIQLVLCLCGFLTCGITSVIAEIWGLVDGVMILTGSIDRDGNGNLLKE